MSTCVVVVNRVDVDPNEVDPLDYQSTVTQAIRRTLKCRRVAVQFVPTLPRPIHFAYPQAPSLVDAAQLIYEGESRPLISLVESTRQELQAKLPTAASGRLR